MFYIPAGTLHAICKDIVIAEIQQSSNVTYRVIDYNCIGTDGMPRKLHVDQALEVTHCCLPRTGYNFGKHLVRSAYFTVDVVHAPWENECDEESFTSLLILDGEGSISTADETLDCRKGDSLLLPARTGKYRLEGDVTALDTRVGTI